MKAIKHFNSFDRILVQKMLFVRNVNYAIILKFPMVYISDDPFIALLSLTMWESLLFTVSQSFYILFIAIFTLFTIFHWYGTWSAILKKCVYIFS